ncbi:MAG: class I SAM-dependent methyltransferase [Kiloniellales bacterium]
MPRFESLWPRSARRRAWFGLLTALGIAERGFFIPYRYAWAQRAAASRPSYAAVEALFAAREAAFVERLGWIDDYAEDLRRIGTAPAPGPRWAQDWFPRLDAAAAYAQVRRLAPRRIVEVGAGHSTRFLLQAVIDGDLDTRITSIDPAPRARLALADPRLTLVHATLQKTGNAPFAALDAGDLLSIDSSHILMPGSDVDILFGHLLPALPSGVLLHLHDIFLPDDYPAAWRWRGYNEQLGVLPLLLGGAWEVLFASHYVATRMKDSLARSAVAGLPLPQGARESSLWLRRR